MTLRVAIVLDTDVARRHRSALEARLVGLGYVVVRRGGDADCVVTDRPLAASRFLTFNIAAEGDEETQAQLDRVVALLTQLADRNARGGASASAARGERAKRSEASTDGSVTDPGEAIPLGGGHLDLARGHYDRGAGPVRLTATELAVLERLYRARGSFVSRATLEREVWGYAETARSRTVLTTIHRLRAKLELDPREPRLLLSDRQRGYRLAVEAPTSMRALEGRLVGREALVHDAMAWLELSVKRGAALHGAVLTLVGPGGVGKTRVARELAEHLRPRRGVVWCDCAEVEDESGLELVLARSLSCAIEGTRRELMLAVALKARKAPVVFLDDLDRGVVAAREVLSRLLPLTGEVRFITTSRVPIELDGERRVAVPVLDAMAGRMMLSSRLGHLNPRHGLAEAELDEVVDGCDRLPLAIELAARLSRYVPLQTLLPDVGDGLRKADLVELDRHGSLDKSLDLSWRTLSEEAKALAAALSALPGGFGFEAVEALASPADKAFSLFEELSTKSLVMPQPTRGDRGGETRFLMLGIMRSYARERRPEGQRQAAGWLARRAVGLTRLIDGDREAYRRVMEEYDREEANFRAVTRWASAQGEEIAALGEVLVVALNPIHVARGPLSEALALVQGVRRASVRLKFIEARLLLYVGQVAEARRVLSRLVEEGAAEALPTTLERGRVHDALASMLPPGPERDARRAMADALLGESALGRAERLESAASATWADGEVEAALELSDEARRLYEGEGVWRRALVLRVNRGSHLRDLGRQAEAQEALEAARAEAVAGGFDMARLYADLNLAHLEAERGAAAGDMATARRLFREVFEESRRHGSLGVAARSGVWQALLADEPMELRARLEVALGFALEVADAEAIALSSASLSACGRSASVGEPRLDEVIGELSKMMQWTVERLLGRTHEVARERSSQYRTLEAIIRRYGWDPEGPSPVTGREGGG